MAQGTSLEPNPVPAGEPSALAALAALAEKADAREIAAEAACLSDRLAEGRFYVVCVGQFKRGKSTLLNALVGHPILPAGILPITSVPTVLRFGKRRAARVRLSGGGWRDIRPEHLATYVAEENNPENKLGVEAVEVFVPSALLSTGMCLVDTPGIGSVFAGNTAATRAFIPHVDAALVVLGADPPISGDELGLVEEVSRQVEHVLFVLNKTDRLIPSQSAEAARFTERVLARRLGRPIAPVLLVSAAERLETGAPSRDWATLERSLESLACESGSAIVADAEERGVHRLITRLVGTIDEQRNALLRPVAESERHIESLSRSLDAAERALADLGALLRSEEERLAQGLREDREHFLAETTSKANEELRKALDATPADPGLRKHAVELARQVAWRHLETWAGREQPAAEALYRGATARFVELANGFLGRFLGEAAPGPEALPAAFAGETGFRARSRLTYTDLLAVTDVPPLIVFLDRLRSRNARRRAASRGATNTLGRLLATNSARLQNDLIDRLRESRARLEEEIRTRLSEGLRTATGALDRAKARRAEGAAAVAAELDRLDGLRRDAARIGGTA